METASIASMTIWPPGHEWDVVVIGAGPAGAITARQLSLMGIRVLLVDRQPFPRWKVCGACINQRALLALTKIELADRIDRLPLLRLTKFELHCRRQKAALSICGGAAISRSEFDMELVNAAIAAGTCFLPETAAKLGSVANNSRVTHLSHLGRSSEVQARVVVNAAGLCNNVLSRSDEFQNVQADNARIGAGAIATASQVGCEPAEGIIQMSVGSHGYVGCVRLRDGSRNFAAALDRDFVRSVGSIGAAASQICSEAGVIGAGEILNLEWKGTAGLTRRTLPVAAERVFVVGDALGYVEPFTGEGIAWAIESACSLAPLVERGVCDWDHQLTHEWHSKYRSAIGRHQRLCRSLAFILRSPILVSTMSRLIRWAPALARPVVQRLTG